MPKHNLNLHLGDNSVVEFGDFKNATYVGLSVLLPIKIDNIQPSPQKISIKIYTSEIETLAEWQSHKVTIDSYLLGYIKDTNGQDNEEHVFEIPRGVIKPKEAQTLSIEVVGKGPGLEDDFVLLGIDLIGAELHLGWV